MLRFTSKCSLVLLAVMPRWAYAELECAGAAPIDLSKCRVVDVNRVFQGSLDRCSTSFNYLYANSRTLCEATAAKINGHSDYGGAPTIGCFYGIDDDDDDGEGEPVLWYKTDRACAVGVNRIERIIASTATTAVATTNTATTTVTDAIPTTTTTIYDPDKCAADVYECRYASAENKEIIVTAIVVAILLLAAGAAKIAAAFLYREKAKIAVRAEVRADELRGHTEAHNSSGPIVQTLSTTTYVESPAYTLELAQRQVEFLEFGSQDTDALIQNVTII